MSKTKILKEGLAFVGIIIGGGIAAGVILSIAATLVMTWMQTIAAWGWIK